MLSIAKKIANQFSNSQPMIYAEDVITANEHGDAVVDFPGKRLIGAPSSTPEDDFEESATLLPPSNHLPASRENTVITKVLLPGGIELSKDEAVDLAKYLINLGLKKHYSDKEKAILEQERLSSIFTIEYRIKGVLFSLDELVNVANDLVTAGYIS